MTTVAVLGTGRVAHALVNALARAGLEVSIRSARDPQRAMTLSADLAVLAVSDDAIGPVAAALAQEAADGDAHDAKSPEGGARAVVHCSGALDRTPLAPLADRGWRTGGWHPLQAFATPDSPIPSGVTWGITADEVLTARLVELTLLLGGHPLELRDEDRARYHAAAAIASNYTDVLVYHAALLLQDCGLERDAALRALLPLVRTSMDGLERAGLPAGLTGPLSRGDVGTVRRHLAALADRPETERLYREAGLATEPLLRERGVDEQTRADIDRTLRGHHG